MTDGHNRRFPDEITKAFILWIYRNSSVGEDRFGQQGAKTAGKPKAGESEAMKKKRASFKARHAKNIAKGKMSAAWWADQKKW